MAFFATILDLVNTLEVGCNSITDNGYVSMFGYEQREEEYQKQVLQACHIHNSDNSTLFNNLYILIHAKVHTTPLYVLSE